jgi:DNA-binding response OmpR family regulator
MASEAESKSPGESAGGGPDAAVPTEGVRQERPGQLGGARADFVASLGRKLADARSLLSALEADATARGPRDELRRKLHALGAGARMLHFDAMTRSIADATGRLDHAAQEGKASEEDLVNLARTLDDLPALAWGEVPRVKGRRVPEGDGLAPTLPQAPLSALIVGGEAIAEALTEDGELLVFECERTEDPGAGLGLARALAPDVVIVDGDLEGALGLVESLLDDPITEPFPIVVLGDFQLPETESRYVAMGVAKTLGKPVVPAALQRACHEVVDQPEVRTARVTLGEPTVEQLGERLAEEIRRALVDTVDPQARRSRVPLGEGSEVLGAVWGAIARVREVITARTDGAVRYTGEGPEGAVAMAPWLHHQAGSDRSSRRGRGASADVSLDRRVVVVADDDPGVTWFIADLLRTTGCIVHEALDGTTALQLAHKHSPQLVVSDILMPGLDGFALCRALRRDVALRDVPVILLSWKEDLLQRVRELGASAAAYLRKESDARAIVARVREVLRPRARIEARLRGEDEVRGRLDDLSVYTLLQLVCAMRPSSRLSVRDASFMYEVEIRDGAPCRATRTAPDGSFRRGERVIASMLGVGAGRFVITPSSSHLPAGDLHGTLDEQLARPLRLAREATVATTGTRTANVDRVVLDEEAVTGYLLATPLPARDVIKRIAEGASPRSMLVKGEVAPTLLEDVLADLAARGAIMAVRARDGEDLLDPKVNRDLDASARAHPPPGATPTPAAGEAAPEADIPPVTRGSSSLEDAVKDAMSDGSAAPAEPASIVDAGSLRPRHLVEEPVPELVVPTEEPTVIDFAPVAMNRTAGEPEPEAAVVSSPLAASAEPPASVERSKTAPSVERARRAGAMTEQKPGPLATAPAPARGGAAWRVVTLLVALGIAGAAGVHWCGSPARTPEPEPASTRP